MSPLQRARRSLALLAVGDAFGDQFYDAPERLLERLQNRILPDPIWPYTDDTEMALCVVDALAAAGEVQQDTLVQRFAQRMEPERGYGVGAYTLLRGVRDGKDWRTLTRSGFDGLGSFGNGAAMRVAPLGAYFADQSLDTVMEQARLSAEVTHAHPEGIAGAVAVAVATALAWRRRDDPEPLGVAYLDAVHAATPPGFTRDGIAAARALPPDTFVVDAALALGNGSGITAPDTVPLCLWVAAHAENLTDALWTTVSALGDRDTTCAIVGGILGVRFDDTRVPDWSAFHEPLPEREP